MPTQVQFRRGTAAQNDNFTGAAGEISINTSNNTIRVHDGSTAGGFELSRKADLTTANVTELTNLYFTAERAIDALSSNTVSIGDLTVTGNLLVQGTSTEISTTSLVVEDKNIVIAQGAADGAAADGAGITVDGASATFTYTNSNDSWSLNKSLTISGNITPLSDNTYDLGSATNRFKDLYLGGNSLILGNITLKDEGGLQVVNSDTNEVIFTASDTSGVTSVAGAIGDVTNTQLVAGVVQAQIDTDDILEAVGNLYYTDDRVYSNIVTLGFYTKANIADLTTANVVELNNLYYSNARAYANIVVDFGAAANSYVNTRLLTKANVSDLTTSNVTEGTNLYFSNTRARDAISAGTGVSYNNGTGEISIGQDVGTTDDVTFANVTVTGDLLVQGNSVTFTANTLTVQDPLIQVGVNPVDDAVDLGFFGHYNDGTVERHAGLFRDATDGQFKLFSNLFVEPVTIVDTGDSSYRNANLVVNFVVGKVTDISNHSTTNLSEGTNLYFTNTRARDSLTQGSGITYTASTGTISANVTSVAGQTGAISNNQLLSAILSVDGSGSTLDADLLDGLSGGGAGAYALKANNLSVFASTTSAELAGVISDETGSGSLVFATSPTLAGTPQAPTAAIGTANTMIATTAFASNASALASGIVNPSRIAGSYTGITGVGTITAGTWQGTSISTTYTDAKITSVAGQTGAISNNQLLAAVSAVDGVGSGLDADTLDGLAGGGSGAYALKANNLSVFASTTSAQLAGVISDETGSGSLVFATSPTFAGTPQVPTAAASTSNNMIASTAFAASATNLTSGTVNTARISGSYTGITGVGTITAGTWNGSSISTTYTDAKLTSVSATSPIATSGSTGAITLSHVNSGVSAATYGNATHIPSITVNATGHITGVTMNAAAGGGGGGGGDFNTAIAGAVGYAVTDSLAAAFTAPSTAGKRYVVRSIQITNISASDADITGDFSGSTYSSISFASTIPVPKESSVELLKRPKVMQPSDQLRLQASASSTLQAVITYETVDEAKHFGVGVDITSAATLTTLHTATANSVIESILLTNDDGGLDVKARVAWTNASDTVLAYLAYDLVIPADATVEVIDAPKFLQSGFKIRVYANQANRVEAIIAGKTV